MKNITPAIAIFFLLTLFLQVKGQDLYKKNRIGYIIGAGLSTYKGDLTPSIQSSIFRPMGGVGISYRLSKSLSLKSELSYFRLKGELVTKNSHVAFSSGNLEASTVFMYDIIKNKKSFAFRENNVPYFFAGLGLAYYNPMVTSFDGAQNLQIIEKGKYSGVSMVIPVGVGMKIKINSVTDIMLELGYRQTVSDYIDNIRDVNPNKIIDGNSVQQTSAVSSNIFKNDGYYFTSVKIVYSPKSLPKRKVRSATPQAKYLSKKNKETSKLISKNKKLAVYKKQKLNILSRSYK